MSKLVFAFLIVISSQLTLKAQDANPLQPFEYLIGGNWNTETTMQTFEWGVGEKSVHSELYFIAEGDTSLAGEITWFWHPGKQKIKGYGHLLSNQLIFFDYSTEFTEPRKMTNVILGYNHQIDEVPIYESLEFIDTNQYRWTMYEKVLDELKPQISIVFKRKN